MAYKLNISKSGYNALTETNPNNLIFSSDYNTLKYYANGSVSFTITAGGSGWYQYTYTLAHNLGYKPFFFVVGRLNTDPTGTHNVLPITNQYNQNMEVYADSNNLYFYAGWGFSGSGSITFYFYYKIFRNNTGL
jgi:hypothetical protein